MGLIGGMTCAVFSAILLLYAADYVFLRIPALADIQESARIPLKWPHAILFDYGGFLWLVMAGLSAASLSFAFRNRDRRGYVAFNLYVLIGSAGFAFLARQAAWRPLMSLFQGIGTYDNP